MSDVILYGDVYACLEQLDKPITVAITSPPYWKQRDYGFEGQIGQEQTPEGYIGRLVRVFGKLREKMSNNGVFFLNVGDKYLSQYGKSHLLQIPYRLGYHMVKDGWRLVDVIIWFKPNHMPSPVKDRFTNTYEPILVFAKSFDNIYQEGLTNVLKIPLQQTPWRHTAVFPEMLVEEMLIRVDLNDEDLLLDPFAGTGTVAVVAKKMRNSDSPKRIFSILIEKGDEFISIIQKRAHIKDLEKVSGLHYNWEPVREEELPEITPKEILINKKGEVFIAERSHEFLSILSGITTAKFRDFHREDALYFLGVKDWSLEDLYYTSRIFEKGYVLRNMLVISNNEKWFPIFMIAQDSTRVAYKFYLDRVRIKPKNEERKRNWWAETFKGIEIRDISEKKTRKGWIVKILERYYDGFPKFVAAQWDGLASVEFILHPEEDEFVMEKLTFRCPKCGVKLEEPYDPVTKNLCPSCGTYIWKDVESLPLIYEPNEMENNKLQDKAGFVGEFFEIKRLQTRKTTSSKFAKLKRINWGASPGARKLMLGEYFTKMRLYRVDQPTVAQYLTVLRKSKGLSIQDVIDKLPKEYKHTVGHWFRKDFGGSTPIPQDIKRLKKDVGIGNHLLDILERTALKFQTVKTSIKGKNPGDFIENLDEKGLANYLEKLFVPPQQYVDTGKKG